MSRYEEHSGDALHLYFTTIYIACTVDHETRMEWRGLRYNSAWIIVRSVVDKIRQKTMTKEAKLAVKDTRKVCHLGAIMGTRWKR